MSNQHYFDVPFGFSGDVTPIPDPLQTGGTVSFTEGWNYNYQRNLSTDPAALPIDRSTMNWLFLQITQALQQLQGGTVPEFILASQNGGTAYPYGAQAEVLWSASGNAPFVKYVNISGSTNTNTPSVADPLGTTTGWQVACDPISTSAQASAGTNNASIMTPLLVAQQTALRALLAGSTSQVFNVGPATVGTHATQFDQLAGIVGARQLNIYGTGLNSTINIGAATVTLRDRANNLLYSVQAVALTPTTGGAVGANSLDAGSWAFSTWYAIYLIYNPITQTTAALFSTNFADAPTLPSGYTALVRIGAFRTQAATNYWALAFHQFGRRTRYVTAAGSNLTSMPNMLSNGSATVYTAIPTGNFVPPTAVGISVAGVPHNGTPSTSFLGIISCDGSSDDSHVLANGAFVGLNRVDLELLFTNIFYAVNGASGLDVSCFGWLDSVNA